MDLPGTSSFPCASLHIGLGTPDWVLGIAVALPDNTARAALSASVGSDFP